MKRMLAILALALTLFSGSVLAQYINASPNPANISAGQSTALVHITWGNAYTTTCVYWRSGTSFGGSTPNPTYCGGQSGSTNYTMPAGTYTFWIGNTNPVTVWHHVTVTVNSPVVGAFASPTVVNVPPGQTWGNWTLSWNLPGYSGFNVWLATLKASTAMCLGFANGSSGSAPGQGIQKGTSQFVVFVPASAPGCTFGQTATNVSLPVVGAVVVTAP